MLLEFVELAGKLKQVHVELDFDSEAFPLLAESNLMDMGRHKAPVQA